MEHEGAALMSPAIRIDSSTGRKLFATRAVIQAPIGQHAIHIEDQQANRGRG